MATLYLIRHGQASFGTDDYDRLSDLGCRQAQAVGEYLRDAGIELDAAYCGDLQRQRKTAEFALASQAGEVSVSVDARFDEVRNEEQVENILPSLLERDERLKGILDQGLNNSKAYQKIIEAVFKQWVTPGFEQPGIQSWESYRGGVVEALRQVMSEQGSGKTVAVFTSGGTIATAVSHVLGVEGPPTYQFYEPVINCSVTQMFYSGDKISLSYFNDHSFLRLIGLAKGENLVTYR